MARCKALTKDGTRCKNEALPDSDFCRIHQGYDGPLAPDEEIEVREPEPRAEAPEVEEVKDEVLVKTEYQKFKIRYTGQTSYWFAGYHFDRNHREREVPREVRDFLLENEPDLFEEA